MQDNTPRSRWRIAAMLLFLAGFGLCFWLATASATRPGDAYRDASQPDEPLSDGRQVGQIITAPLDQLVGVRLWLRRPAQPRGTLALLLRSFDQQKDLATVTLPIDQLPADGPTTFSLAISSAPFQMHRPETIELRLTTQGVASSDPLGVGAGKNGYGHGLLLRNGKEVARSDLAFETLYQSSLFDQILPISRIAYARPGIFGWPPFYALLAYVVLVALVWLVSQLFRAALHPAA